MSAIKLFQALAALAPRITGVREAAAYRERLDAAVGVAFEEAQGDLGSLWIAYLAADDAVSVDRPRPSVEAQSNLPPRVERARAAAYMNKLTLEIRNAAD